MLALCVMPTAIMQFHTRIKRKICRYVTLFLLLALTVFTVVGRVLSGVHWLTDIAGGVLLSAGLVTAYHATVCSFEK